MKKKQLNDADRLSIRFSPNDFLTITELSESFKVSKSLLVRTMVTSFINKNSESLYNLIDNNQINN